jgi:hypothetical protein
MFLMYSRLQSCTVVVVCTLIKTTTVHQLLWSRNDASTLGIVCFVFKTTSSIPLHPFCAVTAVNVNRRYCVFRVSSTRCIWYLNLMEVGGLVAIAVVKTYDSSDSDPLPNVSDFTACLNGKQFSSIIDFVKGAAPCSFGRFN